MPWPSFLKFSMFQPWHSPQVRANMCGKRPPSFSPSLCSPRLCGCRVACSSTIARYIILSTVRVRHVLSWILGVVTIHGCIDLPPSVVGVPGAWQARLKTAPTPRLRLHYVSAGRRWCTCLAVTRSRCSRKVSGATCDSKRLTPCAESLRASPLRQIPRAGRFL